MKLKMRERKKLTMVKAQAYLKAGKTKKSVMLDDFCESTGYCRRHAARVLHQAGQRYLLGECILVADPTKHTHRHRPPRYGPAVQQALITIWSASTFLGPVRLVGGMPLFVENLVTHGHFHIDEETRRLLLQMSPATTLRLLAGERERTVCMGSPIPGASRWVAGFLFRHAWTLHWTSRASWPWTWWVETEDRPWEASAGHLLSPTVPPDAPRRGPYARKQKCMWSLLWSPVSAGTRGRSSLSILTMGVRSTPGHLVRFCHARDITFTRSRPYHKNDNAHVEEKNNSVIRKFVGYDRHDTQEEVDLLNRTYRFLHLLVNWLLPSQKLLHKVKTGSHITKVYDRAQTPCAWMLARKDVAEETKEHLRVTCAALDMTSLLHEIFLCQDQLDEIANRRQPLVIKKRGSYATISYDGGDTM